MSDQSNTNEDDCFCNLNLCVSAKYGMMTGSVCVDGKVEEHESEAQSASIRVNADADGWLCFTIHQRLFDGNGFANADIRKTESSASISIPAAKQLYDHLGVYLKYVLETQP